MAVAAKDAAGPGMDRAELKRSLVLAKRQPMHCAFALGSDGKAVIMIDKIKKGAGLDRDIKSKAPDAKNHRFGIVQVDEENPKLARFIVNKAGGGLARKLVIALKGTGFSKVLLQLEDGTAVESEEGEDEEDGGEQQAGAATSDDGETMPSAAAGAEPSATPDQPQAPSDYTADGTQPQDAAGGAMPDAAMQPLGETSPVAPDATQQQPTGPDAAALAADLKGLVTQMLGVISADPTKKAGLAELATDAQASLKRGDLQQASAGIDVLRQALGSGQSGNGAAPSAPAAADPSMSDMPITSGSPDVDTQTAPADTQTSPADMETAPADTQTASADAGTPDATAPDGGAPDLGSLASSLTDLVKRMLPIIQADPTQQDSLRGIAQQAQAGLKGGDAGTASEHIETLRGMIEGWTSNGAAAGAGAAGALGAAAGAVAAGVAADGAATNGAAAGAAAGEATNGAATNGAATNGAAAGAAAAGVAAGAAAAAAANGAAAQPKAPASAPAIAKARTAWVATRQKVEGDLGKLHAAFGTAFKGHHQENEIAKAFRDRVETVLNTLDGELASTLDAVNNAKDPAERQQLVQQAHGQLQKYQQHIATDPTIAALDSNPFAPMAVAKTMNTTIDALVRTIA